MSSLSPTIIQICVLGLISVTTLIGEMLVTGLSHSGLGWSVFMCFRQVGTSHGQDRSVPRDQIGGDRGAAGMAG